MVGDDLLVTDPAHPGRRKEQLAAAALIKPNRVGTVTETLEALGAAREAAGARWSRTGPARRPTPSSPTWPWPPASASSRPARPRGANGLAKDSRPLEIEAASGA